GSAGEQAEYCALVTRDPNYSDGAYTVTNINMPLLNLASYKVEGWDLAINYRLPETAFGQFTISWDSTYLSSWETKATADSEPEQFQGRYLNQDPYWRIRSNLYVDWSLGDFGINWGLRYKSGMAEACPLSAALAQAYCSDPNRVTADGASPRNHIGATTYHDIQVRYNTPWNATVSVGLNNAFDKDPPVAYSTSANRFDPQYDLPGRYMYMQYRQRF
ncbi:TonB-dependent receptor, partial [Xanthomonas perforans]|nr:TonB-dependent receptor [Xanthomonas perforans]